MMQFVRRLPKVGTHSRLEIMRRSMSASQFLPERRSLPSMYMSEAERDHSEGREARSQGQEARSRTQTTDHQ